MAVAREFFEARVRGLGAAQHRRPIFVVGCRVRGFGRLIESDSWLTSRGGHAGTRPRSALRGSNFEIAGPRTGVRNRRRYSRVLGAMPAAGIIAASPTNYLDDTRIYRPASRGFHRTKMPNNLRHIGLIHLMFPNAKIIDAAAADPWQLLRELQAEFWGSVGRSSPNRPPNIFAATTHLPRALIEHWGDARCRAECCEFHHEDWSDGLETAVFRLILDLLRGCPSRPPVIEIPPHRKRSIRYGRSSEQGRPAPSFRGWPRTSGGGGATLRAWLGPFARKRSARHSCGYR